MRLQVGGTGTAARVMRAGPRSKQAQGQHAPLLCVLLLRQAVRPPPAAATRAYVGVDKVIVI